MADHRITDFVDQTAIDRLKDLSNEMKGVKDTYIEVAKELVKGLNLKIDGIEQIDAATKNLEALQKKAAESTEKYNSALEKSRQIVNETTAARSRMLDAADKEYQASKAAYTEQAKVNEITQRMTSTYDKLIAKLNSLNEDIQMNKEAQKALNREWQKGAVSGAGYIKTQNELVKQERLLKAEKATLNLQLKNEEKLMQANAGSYTQMSQQLELMKKAYKEMTQEQRESAEGQELQQSIKNLSAELKDIDQGLGDFHRNVGNYAVACQNGVVVTEDLNRVLDMQAGTVAACIEQNKELEKAKLGLSTTDADYAHNIDRINAKIEENKRVITDVDGVLQKQATTVAEAEAQNKQLAEALKLIDLTSEGASKKVADINAKIEENNKVIQDNTGQQQSIKKDLKEMVLEIANLTIQYQALSEEERNSAQGQALAEHLQSLIERAGALKDAIADTNQAISNAASDTRGLDQLGGALQLAIDGFGLAAGAAEILGISEGELAEIQTKLQAAIAASNAMTKIQNALQKQSAVMQGVANLQTKAGAIAIKLKTAAEGKGVVTTKLLTAAQWLFNKACTANPIGLLVVAIMACIAAVTGLIKVFNIFGGDSEKRKKKYQDESKALEDLKKSNDKLIEQSKARGATEEELSNLSIEAKKAEMVQAEKTFKAASEAYDEDEEDFKTALDNKQAAVEAYYEALEGGHNKVLAKISAFERETLKLTLSENELAVHDLDNQYEQLIQITDTYYQKLIDDCVKSGQALDVVYSKVSALQTAWGEEKDKLQNMWQVEAAKYYETEIGPNGGIIFGEIKPDAPKKDRVKGAQRSADELKKAVKAGEDALLDLITDSLERQRAAENLSYDRKLAELKDKLSKTNETQVEMRTALQNQIEGLTASHNQKLAEIEQSFNDRRLKAEAQIISSHLEIVKEGSAEELEWKLKQLDNQKESELMAITKAENAKTLTAEQANEMRANLAIKYARIETELAEEYAGYRMKDIQDRYAGEQAFAETQLNAEIARLKRALNDELALAGDNAEKREEIQRKYDEKIAELQEDYAQSVIMSNIDMYKEILQNEDLSAEERAAIQLELLKLEIDLENAKADAVAAANDRILESDKRTIEKRMEALQTWLKNAADGLNAIMELADALSERKIQNIEAEQEANNKQIEEAEAQSTAESERVDELINKKVISQEEGEARKRAAEAKTAEKRAQIEKKNEELEKKKQQLQYRQAVWDKANKLAQAGISTALGIMQTIASVGFPAAIPLIATVGALGALQLATILATPIPKYKSGTDYHKGGLAIVGDGGKAELVFSNGEYYLTPDTPTLVDIPKGAKVYPEADIFADGSIGINPNLIVTGSRESTSVNVDFTRLERKIESSNDILKSIAYQQRGQNRTLADALYRAEFEKFKAEKGL